MIRIFRLLLVAQLLMGVSFLSTAARAEMISVIGKVERGPGGITIKDYFCLCVTGENCPCVSSVGTSPDPVDPEEAARNYTSEIIVPETADVRIATLSDGFSQVHFDSEVKVRFVDSFEASIFELQEEIRETNETSDFVNIPDDDIQVIEFWASVGRFAWKHRKKLAAAVLTVAEVVVDEVTDDDDDDDDD
jgi:hypothetical protein